MIITILSLSFFLLFLIHHRFHSHSEQRGKENWVGDDGEEMEEHEQPTRTAALARTSE